MGLGIALFSYAGHLFWGVNADWEHVGGLHPLVDGIRDACADLLAAARAQPAA